MMEKVEKFTPGPWVRISGNDILTETGDMVVGFECSDFSATQNEYDARLVAAAPDMYAALKAALPILISADDCGIAYEQAKNALSKALVE